MAVIPHFESSVCASSISFQFPIICSDNCLVYYSTNYLAVSNPESYQKDLIYKTESFMRRARWRAFYHLLEKDDEQFSDEDDDPPPTQHYGFPSPKCPPFVPELAGFESDLWCLVDSVSFTTDRNDFQKVLLKDIREIKK